ncbi:MAG TPA: adenylosuccinate lyase [Flavobacteriales bacterium]|nr:adenylosuccinate lyase [Flavobacteriales bacterium]
MKINELSAISPIDGRYRKKAEQLSAYFSEYALMRYRILVEIEYFIALCEIPIPSLSGVNPNVFGQLRKVYTDFNEEEADKIKEIENVTNHDVKAIEYYIKENFDRLGLEAYKEFVHFGLTSQDVNNTSVPLSLKEALDSVVLPLIKKLINGIEAKSADWSGVTMLARTHGQPASPTDMGKEFRVFSERLKKQLAQIESLAIEAKFGGATGNFNAHKVAYPEIDWITFANGFVKSVLGLERQQTTTQIEHYDNLAAMLDAFSRINTILIDFSRDVWIYISIGYFGQKVVKGEVGSSAMPHKVNPIDFENAEGNLGMGNAVFQHLSHKLPISRLQRDLTDSTVLRNIGVPFAHSLIAYQSLLKGLDKLLLQESVISNDLDQNWTVLTEAIQTVLRREGHQNPYEALKELSRGKESISQTDLHNFIDGLDLNESVKSELKKLKPSNYSGYR